MHLVGRFGDRTQGGLGLYRLGDKEYDVIKYIERLNQVVDLDSEIGGPLEQQLRETFQDIEFGERSQGSRYLSVEPFSYFPALGVPLLTGVRIPVHSPFDANTNPTLQLFILKALDIEAPWRYLSLILGEEQELDYVDPLILEARLPDEPKIQVVQKIEMQAGDEKAVLKAIADVHDFTRIVEAYQETRFSVKSRA